MARRSATSPPPPPPPPPPPVAGRLGLEPRLHGTKGRRAADYPISHCTGTTQQQTTPTHRETRRPGTESADSREKKLTHSRLLRPMSRQTYARVSSLRSVHCSGAEKDTAPAKSGTRGGSCAPPRARSHDLGRQPKPSPRRKAPVAMLDRRSTKRRPVAARGPAGRQADDRRQQEARRTGPALHLRDRPVPRPDRRRAAAVGPRHRLDRRHLSAWSSTSSPASASPSVSTATSPSECSKPNRPRP